MACRGAILVLLAIGCGSGGGELPVPLPEAGVDSSVDAGDDAPASAPDAATAGADLSADVTPSADLAPARLAIDPAAADFGWVSYQRGCDPSKIVTFRLTNLGGATSGPIALELPAPFIAKVDGCSGQSLGAGARCEVQVQFQPSFGTSYTGTLLARAAPGGEVQATLTGLGGHGDALVLTPNIGDFGAFNVGAATPARSFEMKNAGAKPLAVMPAVTSTQEFVVTGDDCGGKTLAPGTACTVQIAFKPASTGAKSALLTLVAEGCGGGAIQAVLLGVGVSDGPFESLPPISFGTVVVGDTSAPVTRAFTNTGGTPTGSLSVGIGGTNASQFRIEASTCVGSLAPGASCAVTMVFRPTTVGDKSAVLVISTALGGQVVVSLSGSGLCNGGVFSTTPVLEFGGVSVSAPPAPAPELIWNLHNISNCDPLGPVEVKLAGPDAAHFGLVLNSCQGATVSPGGKCVTTVFFKPTTVGAKTALLEFRVGSTLFGTTMISGRGI
jgi:hypothetical protein